MDKNEKKEEEKQELKEEIEKYNEMLEDDEPKENEETEELISSQEEKVEELEELSQIDENDVKEAENKSQLEENIEDNSSEEFKNTKKKNGILTIIIIILVLLIASSGGLWVYKLEPNKKTTYKSIDDYTEEEKEIIGFSNDSGKNEIEKEVDKIKKEEEKKKEELLYTPDYLHYEQLSEEEKEKMEIVPEKEKISIDKLEDLEEEIKTVDEIPAKFNINDVKKLKVDNQESFGLCWAFATLESMETHYLLKNNEQIDLSELALDFLISDQVFGYREIHTGGNFRDVIDKGNIKGIRKEKGDEYHQEILNLSSDPLSFLDEEDKERYYLTDYVNFPFVYKENGVANISDEELSEFRNLIKRHIMTNGSLYVTVNHYQLGNINIYNSSNNFGDHAVSIVGWDDNYSKDNFKDLSSDNSDKKPIHDGAYIIKNSWGDEYGDNGYHYVSYDDQTIGSGVYGVLSMDTNRKTYLSNMPDYLVKEIRKIYNHTIKKDEKGEYVFNGVLKEIRSITITENDNISNEDFKLLTELLTNLSHISIDNSKITDISPISELNNLQALQIYNNPSINNFYLLGNVKQLLSLELKNDGITDISFISGLNKISYLDLSDNYINDISPIVSIDKLYTLRLNNNNISDVSILKDMNIESIYLSGNIGITGYGELSNAVLIDISNCGLDNIEDMRPGYINISNNNITTLPNLKDSNDSDPFILINASNNKISDLSNLNKKYKYQSLDLSNNQISDISILNDINVTNVNLSNNKITDTSKYNNDKIAYLNLSGNKDIKITKTLKNVQSIDLSNCNINSLNDLFDLESVMTLTVKNNNIKNLDGLDKLNKLSSLDLSKNKISTLKNTPESNVTNLVLTDNDLKELEDISNLKKLNTLYLDENKNINSLNQLKNVESLKYLYLNDIGEFDVSNLSDVMSNTKNLSISLMRDTLKGKLKGEGAILNISNSTYDNLNIDDTQFSDINMSDSNGDIKFENVIHNFDYSPSKHLSIFLGDRKISYDIVKNNSDTKNLSIIGGSVDYKINFSNNEYKLDNKDERTLLINSFANSALHDVEINDKFNLITKIGENPYMIPISKGYGFHKLKYNIIEGNPAEDAESSLYYKYVKLPIRSLFRSLFNSQ